MEIQSALSEVFKTQQFILGPQVKALEQAIAQYSETRMPSVSLRVQMPSSYLSWL